ncbi:MAG: SEC-C metal-binding domain-containing protein [Terracidiphilus sp.]
MIRSHYLTKGERPWLSTTSTKSSPFERSSKRRTGYPSETHVRRGLRIVRTNKELLEKLGREDLCPCGSGRSFQEMLHAIRQVRRGKSKLLLSASSSPQGACALRRPGPATLKA